MTGDQYNIALSIFFIPFVLAGESSVPKPPPLNFMATNIAAEIPSNMILNKATRPSRYIGSLVVLLGLMMACAGFVHSFSGLAGVRFLQGVFEYAVSAVRGNSRC